MGKYVLSKTSFLKRLIEFEFPSSGFLILTGLLQYSSSEYHIVILMYNLIFVILARMYLIINFIERQSDIAVITFETLLVHWVQIPGAYLYVSSVAEYCPTSRNGSKNQPTMHKGTP